MSQVTVTISGSVHEVQETLRGLGFLYGEPAASSAKAEPLGAVERASKPAIKKAEVKKAEVAPATPVVTPAPQATPAATAAALGTKTSRQMTISEMIPAALKTVSKDKLVELLKTFGATKGGEIKPADEERFIAALKILTAS